MGQKCEPDSHCKEPRVGIQQQNNFPAEIDLSARKFCYVRGRFVLSKDENTHTADKEHGVKTWHLTSHGESKCSENPHDERL